MVEGAGETSGFAYHDAALAQTKHQEIIAEVLRNIELRLEEVDASDIMSVSFTRCYEDVSRHYLQGVDNDSGYVSHAQESTASMEAPVQVSAPEADVVPPVFHSEDALLEQPPSSKKFASKEVFEEFSHLYYLNSIVQDSVEEDEKSPFAALKPSSEEESISPVIGKQAKIEVNLDKLEIPHTVPQDFKQFFEHHKEQTSEIFSESENLPENNCASNSITKESREVLVTMESQQLNDSEPSTSGNCSFMNADEELRNDFNAEAQNENAVDAVEESYALNRTPKNDFLSRLESAFNQQSLPPPRNFLQEDNDALREIVLKGGKPTKMYQPEPLNDSNQENDCNVLNVVSRRKTPNRKRKRSTSQTPKKSVRRTLIPVSSPDLFSDEESSAAESSFSRSLKTSLAVLEEKLATSDDKTFLKRVQKPLSGVLPPPSVTHVYMTVDQMLEKIQGSGDSYWWNKQEIDKGCDDKVQTLLVNAPVTCLDSEWPSILEPRYHGLLYNRSKLSEEIEILCMKYGQRYVGSETQSSCTVFNTNVSSPSKRKANRLRWGAKSPGRRLSHLARRRITFSSANLQSVVGGSSGAGTSHVRQIMVDAKRFDLLSRKGKSPRKTPKRSPLKRVRTPSSSTKKRATLMRLHSANELVAGPSTTSSASRASATKRALFQSPDKLDARKIVPSTSNPSQSPWKKRTTPKRALFVSPVKSSPSKGKRKRLDTDEGAPSKIARSYSMCENASANSEKVFMRVRSDTQLLAPVPELSAHHKKKLQWAVYEALRSVNVTVTDTRFKQFASVLARVTRRLLPALPQNGPKPEVGTSERMLRIAKQHVFSVTRGKTVDEIVQAHEISRLRAAKPSGYVSKEEAAKRMDVGVARRDVFQDRANTINSVDKNNDAPVNKVAVNKRADRVRKIINFDEDSGLGSFR